MIVTITRMGAQGDAIADAEALFAAYALPGERVEGVREKDRLHVERILEASAERIEPECLHFGRCGGCLLQHWRNDAVAAWKRQVVRDELARQGVEAEVAPLLDAHGAGRRRVIFHARQIGSRTLVGFAQRRSHVMVPIEMCPVLAPELDQALDACRAVARALAPLAKPLDLQVTATESGLDMDVRGSGPLPPLLAMDLAAIAERFGLARLTRHGELVIQRAAPLLTMGMAQVELPPGGFLQATAEGEAFLAQLVLAGVAGARKVADLFCGVGTFALRLAANARVVALEASAPAVAALKRASERTPGLKAVDAQVRDLFRRPLLASELKGFEAVVIDPPRQGAEAQAGELARSAVSRLVYVSCSPATFARDAARLVRGGYRLEQVTPVDQFRYSPHVEVVGLFTR